MQLSNFSLWIILNELNELTNFYYRDNTIEIQRYKMKSWNVPNQEPSRGFVGLDNQFL